MEDDGGDGDELDLEMREASARKQHEGELGLQGQASSMDPAGGASKVDDPQQLGPVQSQEQDDGAEISGSTSPLILLGNNEGQVVSKCVVKDPR